MRTAEAILMHIRSAGANDRYQVTAPVDGQLRARGLTLADIGHALSRARVCIARDDGTYGIGGVDLDGGPLTLVVAVPDGDGGVLVVSQEDR
jgi:hypothetical protein